MDSRRFDGLVRALARGRSRRGMLRALAGLTVGGLLARTSAVHADGEPVRPVGTGACLPVASPVAALAGIRPPYPALIVVGSCEAPDLSTAYPLFDVTAEERPVGAPTAAAVAQSVTTVRVPVDDLIRRRHAIVVQVGDGDETMIACGDVGGLRVGDDLTVGLRERSGSGYSGIAWLRGSGESTLAYVFLGRGLCTLQAAIATEGATVIATVDLNLRAAPSPDAAIVAVIAEGTKLTITGAAQGDWLPVQNPATGDEGYVAAQFLILAE